MNSQWAAEGADWLPHHDDCPNHPKEAACEEGADTLQHPNECEGKNHEAGLDEFAQMDSNNDGVVSREEWMAATATRDELVRTQSGDAEMSRQKRPSLLARTLSNVSTDLSGNTKPPQKESDGVVEPWASSKEPCPACEGADWLPHSDDCTNGAVVSNL